MYFEIVPNVALQALPFKVTFDGGLEGYLSLSILSGLKRSQTGVWRFVQRIIGELRGPALGDGTRTYVVGGICSVPYLRSKIGCIKKKSNVILGFRSGTGQKEDYENNKKPDSNCSNAISPLIISPNLRQISQIQNL